MTPQERCDTAMAELDEILERYQVELYVDEEGTLMMVPAEDEIEELVFEPTVALH